MSNSSGGSHDQKSYSQDQITPYPYISGIHSPHSKRYMYYNKSGKPKYIYLRTIPRPKNKVIFIITLIILLSLFLFLLVNVILIRYKPIEKIEPLQEYQSVHIQDNAFIFNDKEKVEASLKSFEDVTGICPYIITVYNSEWKEKYPTFYDYAYCLYDKTFSDQQHLLIVCSKADNTISTQGPADISYYAYKGRMTYPVISENGMGMIKSELNENFQMDSVTTDDAFIKTFDDAQDFLFSFSARGMITTSYIFFFKAYVMIILFLCVIIIKSYIRSRRKYFPAL